MYYIMGSFQFFSCRLLISFVFIQVNVTCLLKVIGGSDFVESDETAASQEFKIDMHVIKNRRPFKQQDPSSDDELFDLGVSTRKRK